MPLGKLLFDPNLEKSGFATNVNRGGVLQISLDSKLIENTILFSANAASNNFPCKKTHGISYGIADNSLYVECSNKFGNCTKDATCYGSIWTYNLATKNTTRLISKSLTSSLNIENYGIHGQPYRSPEGTFMFVPNGNEDTVHILKPVKGGKTQIREVTIKAPGTIAFWPKDPTITFGEDANPENYVMAVLCFEGVKFIDFKAVVAAFATEDGKISASDVTTVAVENTGATVVGGSRAMKRGSDYLVLASYNKKTATRVALVNVKTRTVKYLPVKYYGTAVWVPIQATENTALIKSLQAKVAAMQLSVSAQSSSAASSEDSKNSNMLTNNALIVAAIAFVISLISIILIVILGLAVRKRGSGDGGNLL